MKPAETALAAAVVAHLRGEDYDVFSEVLCDGNVADIVATRADGIALVVETKAQFGITVLEQAYRWKEWATHVAIATPAGDPRGFIDTDLRRFMLHDLGIGWYTVTPRAVTSILRARQLNSAARIVDYLHPEQRTFAEAGNAKGQRFTPYQKWMRDVAAWVAEHPGKKPSQVVDAVPGPYGRRSAEIIKATAIEGRIRGVRAERIGGIWRLYPSEAAADAREAVSA